jgi:cephalosporin-C deacetylase
MPQFDMKLEELQTYRPAVDMPEDFQTFWDKTLAEAKRLAIATSFEKTDAGLHTVDVFDVTFSGYAGQPIKAWLLVPAGRRGPLPCVVEYIGYGGGRGFPVNWLHYSAADLVHFVMDTRGQGSTWQNGDTPDVEAEGSNPQFPGFMTRGILKPETYYYRRLITDAVRAVEAAREHPAVNPDAIGVAGNSQGGGLCLAVAGLAPSVRAALPDVPYLCHYRRATVLGITGPYLELVNYCKTHRDKVETVFRNLSYFDGVNFAKSAAASALFAVGLMDDICPPSTVFAAYNHYAGPKRIEVYEYNQHDGGGNHHLVKKIRFLQETLF